MSTVTTKFAQPVYPYTNAGTTAGTNYAFLAATSVTTGVQRSEWNLHFYGTGCAGASDCIGAVSVSAHFFVLNAAAATAATDASKVYTWAGTAADLLPLDPTKVIATGGAKVNYMRTASYTLTGAARQQYAPVVNAPQDYQVDFEALADILVPCIRTDILLAADRQTVFVVLVASNVLDLSEVAPRGQLNADIMTNTS